MNRRRRTVWPRLTVARGLLGTLAVAQVAYGRGRGRPPRPAAATRGLVVLMLATSAAAGVQARGRARGLSTLGAAAIIGFGAELAGVASERPFGHYAYTDRLGPRCKGVPLLAAAAWAMMARPAWIAAGWIAPRARWRVPVAAVALTAWDVFLDPRMVREGYWTWSRPGRYEDVPMSNFVGWLATGLTVFGAMQRIDGDAPDRRDDDALALYAWTWVAETFANAALWRRPVVAAAGGTAMGAIAVPALWRRWR